jgi:hypothetical protein
MNSNCLSILENLNKLIHSFQSSGLYKFWRDYETWQAEDYGKSQRKKETSFHSQINARYATKIKNRNESWTLSKYMIQVIGFGVLASTIVFLAEFLSSE